MATPILSACGLLAQVEVSQNFVPEGAPAMVTAVRLDPSDVTIRVKTISVVLEFHDCNDLSHQGGSTVLVIGSRSFLWV